MEQKIRTKYDNIISLVLRRYSGKLQKVDIDDIRQEISIALLDTKDISNRLAYRIIERRVIDYLRRNPPRMSDIDDPDVLRQYNKQSVHFPDYDRQLDGDKAMEFIFNLPNPHKRVMVILFYDGRSEKTAAELCGKSDRWIRRIKEEALMKLRNMME